MKWVICAIALVGCTGHDAGAPAQRSDIVVVSAGFLPRAALRYALPKGAKTTLALDVASHLQAGELQNAPPPLHVVLELSVDDVLPDGRMKLTSTITAVTATGDGPAAAHVRAEGDALAGLAITSTLSPDGTLADVRAADKPLPATVHAELALLLGNFEHLAMPLPATPIGIGATWRSARPLAPAIGMTLATVTTIDVVGRSGSTLTFAMRSEVHGGDQTVVQEGVPIDIEGITGTAHGTGTLDLARLALDATESAELHMTMTAGSDRTPMTMTQTLRVTPR